VARRASTSSSWSSSRGRRSPIVWREGYSAWDSALERDRLFSLSLSSGEVGDPTLYVVGVSMASLPRDGDYTAIRPHWPNTKFFSVSEAAGTGAFAVKRQYRMFGRSEVVFWHELTLGAVDGVPVNPDRGTSEVLDPRRP
jgi:hypothetical protein